MPFAGVKTCFQNVEFQAVAEIWLVQKKLRDLSLDFEARYGKGHIE